MPLNSVVVSAWLSDVQTAQKHASLRKRPLADLDPSPLPRPRKRRPRKRQPLVETAGNMDLEQESPSKSTARRRSPRKPAGAPKDTTKRNRRQPPEHAARENPATEGERGRAISRDTVLDHITHPILSPSLSSRYTTAILANTASIDGASWDVVSASQKSKNSGRRLPSPTKTVSDMEMLDKPIRYCFRDEDEHLLPPELEPHWDVLETLCNNVGIIPTSIETSLAQRERVFPHMMAISITHNVTPPDNVEHAAAHQVEFITLMGIRDAARDCSVDGSHEPGWNGKVHQPLLSCALEPIKKRFKSVNVTLAKPLKEFAPLYKDDPSDPKIVDFLITLKPLGTIAEQVRQLLRSISEDELRTINQTSHTRYEPAVLSIETKRGHNDEEDAKFKLAMWTAAWQNQIGRFTKGATCTPLPGLIVFGHVWNLYWLVDLGTSVDVVKFPYPVGDTQTITGCYRLIAVIRHICGEWAENVFLPWFTNNVLP